MKHLYLVRHGQSEANASQTVSGIYDSPLSELGEQQAQLTGQNVKKFFKIDRIVSSPLKRALQTAQCIAEQAGYPTADITILDDLRERNLGDLEAHPKSEVPNQYTANIEDIENIPNIERLADFYSRLQRAHQTIQAMPEDTILIVAHNGSGRMLKTVLEAKAPEALHSQPRLDNGLIYTLL